MSREYYHLEAVEAEQAGHSFKKKVTAVYALAGYIEQRYRNGTQGEAQPYWAYVECEGKETGYESDVSLENVQRMFTGKLPDPPRTKKLGELQRLFIGLQDQAGEAVDKDSVLEQVAKEFESFTALETTGYYRGKPHPSLVIEIAGAGSSAVEKLARELAERFDQEAVGVEVAREYKRIFSKKDPTPDAVAADRKTFNQFVSGITRGVPFQELDADIQAWWLNRY